MMRALRDSRFVEVDTLDHVPERRLLAAIR